MSKPVLDLSQHADEAFYALIGRVSLLLVEQNVDAITITMFLRELVEAGGVRCGWSRCWRLPKTTSNAPPRHRSNKISVSERVWKDMSREETETK